MRTITAGQLRARLGEALDAASVGERILIERDHVPIAAIVPVEDAHRLEGRSEEALARKRAAMAAIHELAERMRREAPAPDERFPDAASFVRWDRDHGHEDGG
jgi:prevent-host-death family protein